MVTKPIKNHHTPLIKIALSYSSVLLYPLLKSNWVRNLVLAPQIRNSEHVSAAVKSFSTHTPFSAESNTDSPVFIFSAGWGSGSTLLQRLVVSSKEVIVWGEPLDQVGPIHRISECIAAIRDDWPPQSHFNEDDSKGELANKWIANLSPPLQLYKEAHQAFFSTWFTGESENLRWGLKEVRLTIDHAVYLKWLFPNAKFLFIYRDIHSSYLSVRRKPWLSIWPSYRATEIVAFAHHWRHLLRGFLDRAHEVDGLVIKYEELVSGQFEFSKLADHINVETIDTAVLSRKIGGRSLNRKPLILVEKLILNSIAGDLRKELGYK